MIDAPVLLITFNRPDYTRQVLAAILKANPKKIYIFNDGPREGNRQDEEARIAIRELIHKANWGSNIELLFVDKNLGCGPGPAKAISWAFEKEDRLIILEDDCLPVPAFFYYCDELLEKYKNDSRIWRISGNNYSEEFYSDASYFFSLYGHSWGWATWKRCWDKYDISMNSLPAFIKNNGFNSVFSDKKQAKFHEAAFTHIHESGELRSHIWDYQSLYSIYSNFGLCIVPKKNLVTNIGVTGTHSTIDQSVYFKEVEADFRIESHPQFIIPDRNYDLYHFTHVINPPRPLFLRILKRIVNLFRASK